MNTLAYLESQVEKGQVHHLDVSRLVYFNEIAFWVCKEFGCKEAAKTLLVEGKRRPYLFASAGLYYPEENRISIMMRPKPDGKWGHRYADSVLLDTLAHELAHLVICNTGSRYLGHGTQFKEIFGKVKLFVVAQFVGFRL